MIEHAKTTFIAGAGGLELRRLVKLSSGAVVHNTAVSTDEPIGVCEYGVAVGEPVAVRLLDGPGTFLIAAAGAINAGAKVYAAADGMVQALPTDTGTYLRIGTALTSATLAGGLVEVLPINTYATETVEA